ncbi:MAG TPA: hypothetical protein VJ836_06105 [Candidatus Saccharimonadales bacterium]|nr:hypothetical protein [Candidatus Saccharimonadales bacterium]
MKAKNISRYIIATALILLVPLVAMQFTDEVRWDLRDFVAIGALLIGAGLVFELVTTRVNAKYRPAVAVIIIAAVLLIWAELAVGIFGSPFAGS